MDCMVPGHPNVFVLGCWERNVSIYLQQVRALNLAYELLELGPSGPVGIVGGGFAGITLGAALARRGREAFILERGPRLLGLQVDNQTRWLHPHIHEWPRPGSTEVDAGLPVCNWHADLAGNVARRVLGELGDVEVVLGAEEVVWGEGTLAWKGGQRPVGATVLAVGLGQERSFGKLPLLSYWLDDTIATERTGGEVTRVLVSGIGEGGLLDALYLKLRAFCHFKLVAEVLADIPQVEERLLALEGQDSLTQAYAALPVPAAVDEALRARLRADVRVTLNGSTPDYLSPKADILNRFLISRLVGMGAIELWPGRLEGIEGSYAVTVGEGAHETRHFDRVLIRHGTRPSLAQAFPAIWEAYYAARKDMPFTEVTPLWPKGYFS